MSGANRIIEGANIYQKFIMILIWMQTIDEISTLKDTNKKLKTTNDNRHLNV